MEINIAAKTDTGKERSINEDAFIVCPNLDNPEWEKSTACVHLGTKGTLLAVADGMGGTIAGDVASRMALDSLKDSFSSSAVDAVVNDNSMVKGFLQKAFTVADKVIDDYALIHPETFGMGTTIVVCWILGDKAYIAWCGDSRCYVYNPASGLKTLTKDHSLVQELVDKGELTVEEAFRHPDNNIITRGLGCFDSESEADFVIYPINPNDVFLLCSDGLCGYCKSHIIEKIMGANYAHVNDCCDKLMQLALDIGGYDNICIALASVSDPECSKNPHPKPAGFFKSLFSRKS